MSCYRRAHGSAACLLLAAVLTSYTSSAAVHGTAVTASSASPAMHWRPRGSASTLDYTPKPSPVPVGPTESARSKKSEATAPETSSHKGGLLKRDGSMHRYPMVYLMQMLGSSPAINRDVTKLVQIIAELKEVNLSPPQPKKTQPNKLFGNHLEKLKSSFYSSAVGAKFAPSPPPPVKYDYNDLMKVLLISKKKHLFPSKFKAAPSPPPDPAGLEKGKFKTMLDAPNMVDNKFNYSVPDLNFNLKIFKGFPPKKGSTTPVTVKLPLIPLAIGILTGKKKKKVPILLPVKAFPEPKLGLPMQPFERPTPLLDMFKASLLKDKPTLWKGNWLMGGK